MTSGDQRRHSLALHREMEGRQAAVKPSIWNGNGPFFVGGPLLGAEWLGPALNAQQIISLWGLCLGLLFAKRASPDSQGTVCHPLFVKPTPSRPTSRVGFGETGKAGFDASHLPPWLIFFYFPPTAFHRLILLVSDERETRKLTARGCQTRLLNQHVIPNQHHPWAV